VIADAVKVLRGFPPSCRNMALGKDRNDEIQGLTAGIKQVIA
jgi:hypothetical protein